MAGISVRYISCLSIYLKVLRKIMKTAVKIVGLQVEIRARCIPNTTQKC